MRRLFSFFLITSSVSALAMPPMPNTLYLGMHGGAAIPGGGAATALQTGYLAGGELGYRFDRIRFEGQTTFIRNHPQSPAAINANRLAYLTNVYYDIPLSDTVMPYFGGGVGVVQSWQSGGAIHTATENNLGFQFLTGLGFNLTAKFMLDFRYRYLGVTHTQAATNGLEVGLNYTFG